MGILGIIFNISTIYLNYTVVSNNGTNALIENIYINPNIIATLLYILTFSSMLLKLEKKSDFIKLGIFTVISLFLLYSSNNIVFFVITFFSYICLTYTKISMISKDKKKYRRYFLIGITILIAIGIVKLSMQPHYIERLYNTDNQMTQQRLNEISFWGNSGLETDFTETNNYSYIFLMENYGKIFGVFILGILVLLTIKIFINFNTIKDEFGKLLTVGIGSFIILQFIINLFSILNIFTIGKLNLPFISYNDCSIIINMVAVSILMGIYSRKLLMENRYCEKENIINKY